MCCIGFNDLALFKFNELIRNDTLSQTHPQSKHPHTLSLTHTHAQTYTPMRKPTHTRAHTQIVRGKRGANSIKVSSEPKVFLKI